MGALLDFSPRQNYSVPLQLEGMCEASEGWETSAVGEALAQALIQLSSRLISNDVTTESRESRLQCLFKLYK